MVRQLYGTTSKCGKPDCYAPLIKIVDGRRTLNSRISHIQGSAPDGPRADPFMTCDEVNDFDNLIVLCLFHADEIDIHVDDFPKELLWEWKAGVLADHEQLQRPVELTERELHEAVATVVASSVATEAIVELARAIQSMRLTAERSRSAPKASWDHFERQRAARDRERMVWDAETGERLEPILSARDPILLTYRAEVEETLDRVHDEIMPRADRVVEAAAGVVAAASIDPTALAWIQRAVDAVIDTAISFDPHDPDGPLTTALEELDQAVAGITALSTGQSVDIPPPPEEPEPPGPTAEEQLVEQYLQLYESATRYVRVQHLDYDADLHQQLLSFAPHLTAVPPTPTFLEGGLTLEQNAGVAAAVARNASDDEFTQVLTRIQASAPEAVPAAHLRSLLRVFNAEDQPDRRQQLDMAIAELAQRVLTELTASDFWNRNAIHVDDVVNLALTSVGTPAIETAVRAALDNAELVAPVLVNMAPVITRIDLMTGESGETVATYSSTRGVPSWLPTEFIADAIVAQRLCEGDEETARLATEFLAAYADIQRERSQ